MAKTVLGLFDNKEHVEAVINSLKDSGYDPQNVSLLMKDTRDAQDIKKDTGADAATGAVSGATTGAIIGGIAGILSAVMLPGLGAIFIGGPLASALGLTGAAATTVSGAATGALAGGVIGALTNLGLSEDEAQHYEDRVKEGAILVAVPAADDEVSDVKDMFEDHNASDVKTLTGALNEEEVETTEIHHIPVRTDEDYSQEGYASAKGGRATRKGRK
jgi:hypothetical protein